MAALARRRFRGEITTRYADRLVFALDNGVHLFIPTAVVYSRDEADLACFCELVSEDVLYRQPPRREDKPSGQYSRR